jgi:type IV pilus assembly protein PilM
MQPADVANPPSGEGWVVQLVCHHYNPYPNKEQRQLQPKDQRRTEFGPYQFITDKVLPKLNSPELRILGVDHVAVAWLNRDMEWTSEKGSQNNFMAGNTVPLLDRAAPPVNAEGGGGTGSGGSASAGMGMGAMGMGMMMGQQQRMMAGRPGMGSGEGMQAMMQRMGGGMMGGMMGNAPGAVSKKDYKMLTRTDFLLQFVWVPVLPDAQPKTPEELKTKLEEIATKLNEAEKAYTADASGKLEEQIEAESLKKSKALDSALDKAFGGANAGANAAPQAGGGPNIPAPPAGVAPNAAAPKAATPASK